MNYLLSDLSSKIINASFEVHRELGPGYREKIYHSALELALDDRNIEYVSEKKYSIKYKSRLVGIHRLDLLVGNKIVVELKAIEGKIPNLHIAQILSYMKATNKLIGLVINFGNLSVNIKRLFNKNYNKDEDIAIS